MIRFVRKIKSEAVPAEVIIFGFNLSTKDFFFQNE